VQLGHWGWQWYAGEAGLPEYDRGRTRLAAGDRVIIPEIAAKQHLTPEDEARLVPLDTVVEPAPPWTFLRTIATEHSHAQGNRAGGFYYFWTSVPWTITRRPLERFRIYTVGAAPQAAAGP
jgi:hypothetical protein